MARIAGETMQLEEILKRNREFVRGREARPLPPAETIPLAVVACYDPRLDKLISESLGLAQGDAFLFRTAGAYLLPEGTVMRSLGLAVYLFGVRDVVVIGHTSCRMAAFDTSSFIDAFRKRGVAREAFGGDDLRTWAGAIPDPKRGVAMTVASIQSAPFLPKDLSVAGLLLDDATGALEVVVKPGERPVVPQPVEEAPAKAPSPAAMAPPPAPATPAVPPAKPMPASDPDPLLDALRDFLRTLEGTQRWGGEIRDLKRELASQKNPLVKLGLLEKVARRAGSESKEARDALSRLQREASATARLRDPRELSRLFAELTGASS
jgi:carbonic anhydrase